LKDAENLLQQKSEEIENLQHKVTDSTEGIQTMENVEHENEILKQKLQELESSKSMYVLSRERGTYGICWVMCLYMGTS